MSDNQYVGARYVPKVYHNPDDDSADWKANVAYEPLTIVVANNGDSYTSRKAVPKSVGTPQNNPEYWTKTGDFNASLLALQNRVQAIVDTLGNETLDTDADTVTGAINELNSNIGDLETFANETFEKLPYGRTDIDNRKILFVGDSYGTIADNWVEQLVELVGIDEDNYENICVSGSGLLDTNVATWLSMVTNYSGNIERAEFTDVIICGGINDMREEDSPTIALIRAALWHLLEYIRNNYPNAKIYVGFIGWVRALNETGGTIRSNIGNYGLPAYYEVATWGGIYLTGVESAVHDARLFDEGENTHPNANGSRQIALAVIQAWLGGNYNKTTVPVSSDASVFDTTQYNPNQTHAVYSFADGYNVHLVGRAVNVGLITPLAVTANSQYTLTKLFTHVTSLMIGSKLTGITVQDTFDLLFDVVYSDSTLALINGACTLHADGSADVVFYAPKDGTINALRLKAFQRTMSMFQK